MNLSSHSLHLLLRSGVTAVVLLLLCACESYPPAIGRIVINPSLPPLHDEMLPIGITLDMRDTERDLLDPNLLLNGDFELAPRLPNCAYNLHDTTITTPNGFRIFYPVPSIHYGWFPKGGVCSVEDEKITGEEVENHFLRVTPGEDSTNALTVYQRLEGYSPISSDTLWLSLSVRAVSDSAMLFVDLTDSLGNACTSSAPPALSATKEWSKAERMLICTAAPPSSTLYLRIQQQGVTGFELDEVSLLQHNMRSVPALRAQLEDLLSPLCPEYIRFPGGQVSNGYYPQTYPSTLDPGRPLWTLTRRAYSTPFSLSDLLTLCERTDSHPIYLANIGITDAHAHPRSEDITSLPARVAQLSLVAKRMQAYPHTEQTSPIIQLGYTLTGQDYARRFIPIRQALQSDTLFVDLISAADLTRDLPFSNVIYDASIPSVSSPEITRYLPFGLQESSYFRQPIMLGEVHFCSRCSSYYLPDLLLRGAFLIEAERHSSLLKGLSLSPLLAPEGSSELSLLRVNGSRYVPTVFYRLLHDFITHRGSVVRDLPRDTLCTTSSQPTSLYTSLTSSKSDSIYYLKAANATRHPLVYDIDLTAIEHPIRSIRVIRYRLQGDLPAPDPSPPYRREEEDLEIPYSGILRYEFAPYEWAVICIVR